MFCIILVEHFVPRISYRSKTMTNSISAIRDIYSGNHQKCDNNPLSKKYLDLLEKVAKHESAFLAELKKYPDLAELFEKFHNSEEELQSESCFLYYAAGFRLGALLGIDIMTSPQ